MKGYPLNTWQTVVVVWAILIAMFTVWAVVIPFTINRVRKVRADRAWLRARAARKRLPVPPEINWTWDGYPQGPYIVVPPTLDITRIEEYERQAAANQAADPEWFKPKEF